jgi:hypothetical protein
MNRIFTLLLIATALAIVWPVPVAHALPFKPGNGWSEIVAAAPPKKLPNGNWEYVYDLMGGTNSWSRFVTFSGFDADAISNLHTGDYGSGAVTGVWQRWDGHTVRGYPLWGNFQDRSLYPSYWNAGTFLWDVSNSVWAVNNVWHSGNDYVLGTIFGGATAANFRRYPGGVDRY